MMTPSRKLLAIWLVPAPRDHALFEKIIGELAARFDAPVFAPHLTLHGGELDAERAARVLREIPVAAKYELEVEGVHSSSSYTKTLFVRFRPSAALSELRAALGGVLHLESGADFDPHVSLLYKEMPDEEKAALAESVQLPLRQITFEGLKLVAHPPEIKTRRDVEAWCTVAERRFVDPPQ